MSTEEPSRIRKISATVLGGTTLVCVVLFCLTIAFAMWQIQAGVADGGEQVFVALFLTAPPAILCTVFALLLVGPRYCKLAWISLCVYPLIFGAGFIWVLLMPVVLSIYARIAP